MLYASCSVLMSSLYSPDLAQHCRLLLNNHPRFPRLVRIVFLYPLYVLSELAIISTDLAELLGSAIGLVLLFPSLPLPVAVLLTATDVVFILALGDSSKNKGRPVRILEFIIIVLVSLARDLLNPLDTSTSYIFPSLIQLQQPFI